MSRFWENALSIFETAASAPADAAPAQMAILIDEAGALRIIESAGWRPDALQQHYGTPEVYQITRTPSGVKVVGRGAGHSCTLETQNPATLLAHQFPGSYVCSLPAITSGAH